MRTGGHEHADEQRSEAACRYVDTRYAFGFCVVGGDVGAVTTF